MVSSQSICIMGKAFPVLGTCASLRCIRRRLRCAAAFIAPLVPLAGTGITHQLTCTS